MLQWEEGLPSVATYSSNIGRIERPFSAKVCGSPPWQFRRTSEEGQFESADDSSSTYVLPYLWGVVTHLSNIGAEIKKIG